MDYGVYEIFNEIKVGSRASTATEARKNILPWVNYMDTVFIIREGIIC